MEFVDSFFGIAEFGVRVLIDFMDLSSHSQSGLCLGLSSSHASPASHKIPIPDDSISLQIDTSFRASSCPIPLQLLDQKAQESRIENGGREDPEMKEGGFTFFGHPMRLKRQRDPPQFPEPCKRAAAEPGLQHRREIVRSWGNQPLEVADPEIHEIMNKEKERQYKGIELIASENFVCRAVMEALGSHLTNKYSEGMPGARYYTGNQYIDQIEILCHERALAAFDLDSEAWGVNVQPYSCTSANFAVYTGLLMPGDRIMGLDSPSGGHISHGYYKPGGKKVSAASIFFESFPYKVDPQTGYIDYDRLAEKAFDYRPKILICGGSSYPREWDFTRFRHIADRCGAVLMCDMAHISGLVAAKV